MCAWTFRPAGGEGAVSLSSGIRAQKDSLLSITKKRRIHHAAQEKGRTVTRSRL
jgi:hypothetical protein